MATEVSLAPCFDSSLVHSGIPPLSLFRMDLVLLVSRFLVVRFTENDLEGCGVGFFPRSCAVESCDYGYRHDNRGNEKGD